MRNRSHTIRNAGPSRVRLWLGRGFGVCAALTLAATIWALSQNPFASALVARGTLEARANLQRALALHVDSDWVAHQTDAALVADDLDALRLTLSIAADRGVALPPPLATRAKVRLAAADAPLQKLSDCAACAWDMTACASIADLASCALPVELTPLGDVNALRRAAATHLAGDSVDRIEVALALTGLAATGAVLVTAGSSASVKAGATALRVARRTGSLSPGLARQLRQMADLDIAYARLPDYLAGKVPLSAVADPAKISRIGRTAQDFGLIAKRTSPAEAISLLGYADTTDDLASLARLADAQGPATRGTLRILGKARSFRMMHRLTDLALATLALLAALAGQCLAACLWAARRAIRP